ncbi:hypothetical protein AGMMS50293_13200 [Spirochaetia bacterium]|nr:hypothetical protein AGMMS50293_13200 [Spirochaetia bacterium]
MVKSKKNELLDHIEKIIVLSREQGLHADFFRAAGKHLDFVQRRLGISEIQSVFFSHFLNKELTTLEEIAKSLNCEHIQMIRYKDALAGLERKRLVRRILMSPQGRMGKRCTAWTVPSDVAEAISRGKAWKAPDTKNISIDELFSALEAAFSYIMPHQVRVAELMALIADNMHLEFCKNIQKLEIDDQEKMVILFFCNRLVNYLDDNLPFHQFEKLHENPAAARKARRDLINGSHILIKMNMIEFINDEGFGDREIYCLSLKARKILLAELDIGEARPERVCGLESYKNFVEKTMFYNSGDEEKVDELTAILGQKQFAAVQNRLQKKGRRSGFACLFYGPPGTGKTETVYQIARKTKRSIMQVNIADTKSKWFGESEKCIEGIFDDYRDAVKRSRNRKEAIPILLFNEADAVFSKRGDIESGRVAQTQNAMQNIILEELEKLDGILIATTNLTQNLDKAFERRFLYKIEFTSPGREPRKNIWMSTMPEIDPDTAEQLAVGYEFSGGQIENIARKCDVDFILHGGTPTFAALKRSCDDELAARLDKSMKRIGF